MTNLLTQPVHPGHPFVIYGGIGPVPPPQTNQEKINRTKYLIKQANFHAKMLSIYDFNDRELLNNNKLLPPPVIRTCPPMIPGT